MASDPSPSSRPDLLFALVAGAYASAVLVPPALFLAGSALSTAGATYIAFLVGVTVVGAGVTVAVRRANGLATWLGASVRRFIPAVVPAATLGVLAGGYAVLFGADVPDGALLFGGASALGGAALGGILALMADTRYTEAVTASATVVATWRAPWPERHRRLGRRVAVVVLAVAALGFVVGAFFDRPLVRFAGQFVLPLAIVLTSWGQERTYRATTAGLELQASARRHLARWDRFEGYTVTDEAIVVHPRASWRLPLYVGRGSLSDEEEVLDALAAHLPRLPA